MSGLDPKDKRLPGMRMIMTGIEMNFHYLIEYDNNPYREEYSIMIRGEDFDDCLKQAISFEYAIAGYVKKKRNQIPRSITWGPRAL